MAYIAFFPIVLPAVDVLKTVTLNSAPPSSGGDNTPVFDEKMIPDRDIESIPAKDAILPSYGQQYGLLTIDSCGINAPLYYGDNKECLQKGLGQYLGSFWPGFGTTVLIAGHNHTYFKPLKNIKVGDEITLKVTWGVYHYTVDKIEVRQSNDETAFDLGADYENLVLYTCYPFGSIGMTPTRYYVYGKYVSGPEVQYEH